MSPATGSRTSGRAPNEISATLSTELRSEIRVSAGVMRRITGVLGSVATLLMASHSAAICGAHVDAAHSTVPKCFVGCPAGDVPFTVVVRDAVGNPSVNAYVTLSFNYLSYIYCPPPKFCPIQEPGTWINGSGVNRTTDGSGTVTFHLAVGGLCPSATVYVTERRAPGRSPRREL